MTITNYDHYSFSTTNSLGDETTQQQSYPEEEEEEEDFFYLNTRQTFVPLIEADDDYLEEGIEFCRHCWTCCFSPLRLMMYLGVIFVLYFIYHVSTLQTIERLDQAQPIHSFNLSLANSVLNNVCDLFATSQISGQTCSLICDSESAIITDYQIGNDKHVLFIKVNGTTKIFKTLHPYFHEYDPLPNDLSEDAFKMAILEKVNNQTFLDFPIAFKDHVVSTIYSSFPTTQISLADKKSIWALLQEPEFINFKILKLSRVVPNIKSTCGHFYEVQNLLPFSMKSYYMNLKSKILLHLMGTLKLFYEFLNEPLEWCDATFENLALSTEYVKRFVIMDADQLYTRAKLNKLLTAKTCQHNDDCTIKDCHSTCLNNKCSERVNENLDVFCDKMVHQLYGNFYSKNNKFLTACNNNKFNRTKRLDDLRLAWAWTIPDV